MKKLIPLLALAFIISCQNQQPEAEQEHEQHENHEPSHSAEAEMPSLNEGQKWAANPETSEGIKTMNRHIHEFERQNQGDYAQLQSQLKEDFGTIISECTMKGRAHDELHVYLMPLKGQIDRLSAENIDTIKAHLQHYNRYFE